MRKYFLIFLSFSYPLLCSSLEVKTSENFIILLGNSGVGKSFIGNFLLAKSSSQFISAYSASSVTGEFKALPAFSTGWQIADTPGLNDNFRPHLIIAHEIKRALTASSELYKLCFVLSHTGGRLNSEDILTTKLILSALKPTPPYYIVVNPYSDQDNQEGFASLVKNLLNRETETFPPVIKPDGIFFMPRINAENKAEARGQIRRFVSNMKSGKITEVSDILKMSEKAKNALDDLLKDPEKYRELLKEWPKNKPNPCQTILALKDLWQPKMIVCLFGCGLALAWFYL